MLRALVGVETETELLDAAQTLKLRSVDQSHHQLAFIGISLETNDVVNWIAIDAFRHCANINRQMRAGSQVVLQDLHDFSGLICKFSDSAQPAVMLAPVEISGFSHFFGFESLSIKC